MEAKLKEAPNILDEIIRDDQWPHYFNAPPSDFQLRGRLQSLFQQPSGQVATRFAEIVRAFSRDLEEPLEAAGFRFSFDEMVLVFSPDMKDRASEYVQLFRKLKESWENLERHRTELSRVLALRAWDGA